ncbi:MAG: DUF1573 domain-containing protein [Kiritimatiellia bacterium]|nr:DUF1573 domain-containing protein [Kiritimatiellia bacterium]MDD4172790.1 DUF1573 domain-containing protein [Kiritimatiellia bacterium]MDD4441626.1 DUF1573 domain-containing protein [Kiritimatiellia bacterium]MDX9792042.1 DUF1573 domain-containing protein [Kiritimatiellia bacterium]
MKSLFACWLACLILHPPVILAGGRGFATVDGADTKALGVFRDSESPSAAFTVRNAGGGPLKITRVMKTCGCAGAEADRDTLAPGDSTTVRVTVEPYSLEGAFSKSVFVLTDAADAQPLRLTVTGECVPLFSVRPSKSVDAGRLPNGASWEGAFELAASAPSALGAPAVTSDCPAAVSVETQAGSTAERPRWRVPVKLCAPTNGSFRCLIQIPVLAPTNRPSLTLEVAGRAGSELFAVPAALAVPVSGETVVRTLRLRLSGSRGRTLAPAELRTLPETEGLGVRAETEPGGGLAVSITVSPGLAKRIAGGGPFPLTFAVPGAATAAAALRTPDAPAK